MARTRRRSAVATEEGANCTNTTPLNSSLKRVVIEQTAGSGLTSSRPMKLHRSTAEIFVPDQLPAGAAARRITHLGIGAHHDDLEFMAFHGILACRESDTQWFGGVTCTDGAASPRRGAYADLVDAEMRTVRRREQNAAAVLGRYGIMIQLDHPSAACKRAANTELKDDLQEILAATRPEIVYTHNLADKHDTHVGVAVAAVQAMRALPRAQRPGTVWGCEVWRGLDWMADCDKVLMDVSGHDPLAATLNAVFDSQITGGKRYDLATLGRRAANATFLDPRATDTMSQLILGMDLTPLVADESLDPVEYVEGFIERFRTDVTRELNRRLGRA